MRLTSNKYKKKNKIFSITGYNFSLSDNEYKSIVGDHFFELWKYMVAWNLEKIVETLEKKLSNLNGEPKKIFDDILKDKNYVLYDALLGGILKKIMLVAHIFTPFGNTIN